MVVWLYPVPDQCYLSCLHVKFLSNSSLGMRCLSCVYGSVSKSDHGMKAGLASLNSTFSYFPGGISSMCMCVQESIASNQNECRCVCECAIMNEDEV